MDESTDPPLPRGQEDTPGTPVDNVDESLEGQVVDVHQPPPVKQHEVTASGGMSKEGQARGTDLHRPPPFGLPCARYAIRMCIMEVPETGVYSPPPPHLWNPEVLRDFLRLELPEVYEVILLDEDISAMVFFGKRYLNEGLTYDEVLPLTQILSAGFRDWIGHRIQLNAVEVAVPVARQQVAKALSKAREQRERKRLACLAKAREEAAMERIRARTAYSRSPSPASPSAEEVTEEEELVGADPTEVAEGRLRKMDREGTSPSPSPIPRPGPKVRNAGPGSRPGTPQPSKKGRPRKSQAPMPAPANSPERGREASDSDASYGSQASHRSRRRGRRRGRPRERRRPSPRDETPDHGRLGTFRLEPLTPECKAHEYLVWRRVVRMYQQAGYNEHYIITQIMNSCMRLQGATVMTTATTVDGVLRKLDNMYKVAGDYDSRVQGMYGMVQATGESVAQYAARVTDAARVLQESFPDKLSDEDTDCMARDRLFGGLCDDLKMSLSFALENLPNYTFGSLLDLIRRHEASIPDKAHQRRATHNPPKVETKPHYGNSRNYPRGRMAASGGGADGGDPGDSGAGSASEEEVHPLATLGVQAIEARLAKASEAYEGKIKRCFSCDSPDHLYADCPTRNTKKDLVRHLVLNAKGGSKGQGARAPKGQGQRQPRQAAEHPGVVKSN